MVQNVNIVVGQRFSLLINRLSVLAFRSYREFRENSLETYAKDLSPTTCSKDEDSEYFLSKWDEYTQFVAGWKITAQTGLCDFKTKAFRKMQIWCDWALKAAELRTSNCATFEPIHRKSRRISRVCAENIQIQRKQLNLEVVRNRLHVQWTPVEEYNLGEHTPSVEEALWQTDEKVSDGSWQQK